MNDSSEKNIGVIAYDTNDFINWKKTANLEHDGIDTKRKFKIGNKIYHCLTKESDLCSMRFSEVIETNDAKSNKEYVDIKNNLMQEIDIILKEKEEIIKVGDKVIANDEYYRSGFIDGEVIEIKPYKDGTRMSNEPSYNNNSFGVTILGRFKRMDDVFDKEYMETRKIYSCEFKVNPTFDVNVTWTDYNSYAPALFFTSKNLKDNFNELIRIKNMNYHLNAAKFYGYKENKI